MGYGGFIKTVIRIAVPAVVGVLTFGNPLAIAISSAAVTGATGGSFKEALISGATSFIGASITQGLNVGSGLESNLTGLGSSSAGANALVNSANAAALGGGTIAAQNAVAGSAFQQALQGAGIGGINPGLAAGLANIATFAPPAPAILGTVDQLGGASAQLPNVAAPIQSTLQPTTQVFGDSSNFEAANTLLPKTLKDLGVTGALQDAGGTTAELFGVDTLFELPGGVSVTGAGLANTVIGGFTGLTLEQALLANDPLVDQQLIKAGFSPEGIQALRQEARIALSQRKFEELTGPESGLENPFLREGQDADAITAAEEEFKKVIASGIERENAELGNTITQSQFDAAFGGSDFGTSLLSEEEGLRKQSFNQAIGSAFPGDAFQSLDDDIINSIVTERQGPAQQQVSRFGARGNLNPTGGRTANEFIQRQIPGAQERVREIGAGVLGGGQRDVDEIRDRAREQVSGFKLGDDLFDVAPFSEERGGLIEERQGTLGADVRGAIGSEPLFDVSGALQAGGRAQGVVSGQGQNQALLDQIAARELGSTSARNRRSLGSRGSGAF